MRALLVLAVLLQLPLCTVGQPLRFQAISTADGLTDNAITALLEDRDGFLWVGTENGLNKYDGHHVWTWQRKDGLEAAHVTAIIQARDGRIHVSFRENTIATFSSTGVLEKVHHPKGIDIRFTCLLDLNDTTLLVGGESFPLSFLDTRNGTFTYWSGQGPIAPREAVTAPVPSGDWCHYLTAIGPDRLAIGFLLSHRQIIVDRHTGAPQGSAFTQTAQIDQSITDALVIGERIIGCGWQQRLHIRDLRGPAASGTSITVPDECTVLAEATDGRVWAGTRTKGLLRIHLESGEVEQFRHQRDDLLSLTDDRVRALLQDREGRLWVGTRRGLDLYDPKVWWMGSVPLEGDAQAQAGDIHPFSIRMLQDGRLVVCTTDGLFIQDRQGRMEQVRLRGPKGPLQTTTLLSYGQEILVGAEQGIFRWSGSGDRADTLPQAWMDLTQSGPSDTVSNRSGMPGLFQVRSILADTIAGRPHLLLGVLGYGLTVLDPERERMRCIIQDRGRTESIGNNLVRTLARTSDGAIWLGTADGLYRWEGRGGPQPDRFRAFRAGNGPQDLPNADVLALLADAEGRLWIGTRNGGLACWDGERMTHLHCPRASGSNVQGLALDRSGRVWCSASGSFEVYDPRNGGWTRVEIPSAQVMAQAPTAPVTLADGSIAFVAENALYRFDPLGLDTNGTVPLPYLTDLRIGDVSAMDRRTYGTVELASDEQLLLVQVSALDLSSPGGSHFTLQVEGLDPEPRQTNADGSLTYASLPPGTYRILARTVAPSGRTSAPQVVATIVKAAPLWQRWWFYAVLAGVAGGLVYVVTRYRYGQQLRLQNVRNRIASDLHDEVGSSLSSITIGSRLAQRLGNGESEQVQEILERIGETSSSSLRSMSDIVWAIDPKNDQGEALVKRMRRVAAELLDSKGIATRFEVDAQVEELKLSMDVRKELLLIYKEAVHNASKYSDARQVTIGLTLERGRLTLTVEDDGIGFDPALHSDGHGLSSMLRRSRSLRGDHTLRSSPGQGTTISVSVDLPGLRAR
ncbi:MAG TPA: two-component regulator propeller domain-containing protein [Flavobacteriales bacterium]